MNPATHSSHDVPVLIIGGGPVGMGLAIELGQRGVRCLVIERHVTPQPIPKGQNLTQRTMEHFHVWGAERRLRQARTIPPEYGIGGLTAYGTLLGPHVHDWLQRDLVKAYYHMANERLPQYATEAVLRERVAELPSVQVLYGWEADTLRQDDSGVTATVCERAGGAVRVVHAAYVVGCDGARSRVREQSGLTQTLTSHDRVMVLLVFRSKGLHELLKRYPGKSYYNVLQPGLQGYWKFFGRVDLGNTWFFHAPVPPGTTADNFDFRAYLHEAVGAEFEVEFEHIGFWDLRFAIAEAYRAGRVFVAGDAAHSHPPYGGYGINSGLEDARNLGWKLAAVLEGWGSQALLDAYDAERRPVFQSTIDDFIAKSIENDRAFLETYSAERDPAAFAAALQVRAQGAVGEVHAFEPHYEGSPVVWRAGREPGVSSAKGSHRFDARAGHHLAPARLGSGVNVFDGLGPGFTLLALDALPEAVQAFRDAAIALKLPLKVLEAPVEGEAARYNARLVLVRPDHFVAWAAGEPNISLDEARRVLALASGKVEGAEAPRSSRSRSEGRLIDIGDTELFIVERGQGYPLILLHGGPGLDHHMFGDYLDALGDRCRLILVDQRANGRSGRPPMATWTLAQHAADVGLLAQALGLSQYAVLGHSYGAFVALQHAVDFPGAAAQTIVSCGVGSSQLLMSHVEAELARFEPRALREQVTDSWAREATAQTASDVAELLRLQLPFHFGDPLDPRIAEFERRTAGLVGAPEVLRLFASGGYGGIEVEDRLGTVPQPVLVLAGRYDRTCSVAAAERIADRLPKSQLHVFERSGHMTFAEQNEEFLDVLRGFLQAHQGMG